MSVHIGEVIRQKLTERGITNRKFAQLIGTGERNLYTIFRKSSIDTGQLQVISKVLDYDFFKLFTKTVMESITLKEPVEAYGKSGGINITFNLGNNENGHAADKFLQTMEDLLPEFLEQEKRKNRPEADQK